MKKTLFVTILATVFVLAFASSAFAGKSSVMVRSGDTTVTAPIATYNDWSGTSTTTAFANFPGNAGSTSPHGGYATATVKCAVCHAAHVAAPSGDTLLRMKASDSCVYCHVATGSSVPGAVVYGGDAAIATASGDDHHTIGSNCSICHASVHGSNAIKNIPSLTGVLLKSDSNNTAVDLPAMANLLDTSGALATRLTTVNDTATRRAAIGIWCGTCHNNAYFVTKASQNAAFQWSSGTGWTLRTGSAARTGHRVEAVANDDWNVGNSVSSSTKVTGRVAWAPATDCWSCHDAKNGLTGASEAPGFPHYSPGAGRFLTAAGDVTGPKTNVGAVTYAAGGGDGGHLRYYTLKDGVCLKCHKGSATTGVGYNY